MKAKFFVIAFMAIAGLTACVPTYVSKVQGPSAKFLQADSRLVVLGLFSDPYQCTGEQIFPRNAGSLFSTSKQPPAYVDIPAKQLVTIFLGDSGYDCLAYASFYPAPNRRYAAKPYADEVYYSSNPLSSASNIGNMCRVIIVDAVTGRPVAYTPRKIAFFSKKCNDDLAKRDKTT